MSIKLFTISSGFSCQIFYNSTENVTIYVPIFTKELLINCNSFVFKSKLTILINSQEFIVNTIIYDIDYALHNQQHKCQYNVQYCTYFSRFILQ